MRCISKLLCLLVLLVGVKASEQSKNLSSNKARQLGKNSKKHSKRQKPVIQTETQVSNANAQVKPCLLFFEVRDNIHEDEFKWRCKMKGQDATNAGAMIDGVHAYVDIQGIELVLAANPDIVSGETLLFAEGAVIEDHLLVIAPGNTLKFDTYQHSTGVQGRRKLATPTGNKDVLVVRVITTDAQPTATAAEMSDSVFGTNGDPVNLKSQYEGCSANQITITPAVGTGTACADDPNYLGFFQFASGNYADCDWFTFFQEQDPTTCTTYGNRADLGGGAETGNNACCACGGGTTSNYNLNVVDGVLEINVPVAATSLTSNQLEEAALNALEAQFGSTNLEEQFELVMLCLPPGTTDGAWVAYAGLPGYVSVYNDNACLYPSVQVHEVGHNVGLTHSSDVTDSNVEYGDRSGMMGISYFVDDGPSRAKMCFNPAKSYILGWYDDKNLDLNLATQSFCGRLVGVANYPTIAGDERVVLKISDTSVDYYVGYNHAVGFHEGTNEAINQVTVVSQDPTFGSFSYLEARLSAGNDYVISNILGSGEDVTIRVVDIDSSASGFAEVQVFRGASDCDDPSAQPSTMPSSKPSMMPSRVPSSQPSTGPSQSPSIVFSQSPSKQPSLAPSDAPTASSAPSVVTEGTVSVSPSQKPSTAPSLAPSRFPSTPPSSSPSNTPSIKPSQSPSIMPSTGPSRTPSLRPSQSPSIMPSNIPSTEPSIGPSQSPSIMPSQGPSVVASETPSTSPSVFPSGEPSMSVGPSQRPSVVPSIAPSTANSDPDQWNCIFIEDFEDGFQFLNQGENCVSITDKGGSNGSQHSLKLAGQNWVLSETFNAYDVSQYSRIRVSFDFRTENLPRRGGFNFDMQINGGQWMTWQRFGYDSYCSKKRSRWCTGQADLEITGGIQTIKFRFSTWHTRKPKTVYIDDVKFEAFGAPTPTANGECPSGPHVSVRSKSSKRSRSRSTSHKRTRAYSKSAKRGKGSSSASTSQKTSRSRAGKGSSSRSKNHKFTTSKRQS